MAERRAALKEQQGDLRSRIRSLRQEISSGEDSRAAAADELKEIESAISDANRQLHRLGEQRQTLEEEVRDLEGQIRQQQQRMSTQQARLSRLLHQRYLHGSPEALQLLLAGRDPNQIGVDHHLLTLLAKATADLIADLRHKAEELKRLADAARDKTEELATLEATREKARLALVDKQAERRKLLAQLATKIRGQRKELGSLEKDEKRLGKLIAGLTRILRKPPKPRPKPKAKVTTQAPQAETRPPVPDESPAETSGPGLAALKGRLPMPVSGTIANRYGQPRPEGGTTWKGLFIRADEGSPVRAVAAGQVVHADWLRGFGNLLIIDHGSDYLSVYGHNQSLVRETGDQVQAGEVIATVGSSGGSAESGLYFELRRQGRTLDPRPWIRSR